LCVFFFFFSSRRRHTISKRDWSSDVCSSDLLPQVIPIKRVIAGPDHVIDSLGSQADSPVNKTSFTAPDIDIKPSVFNKTQNSNRSEERRVGKERRSRR